MQLPVPEYETEKVASTEPSSGLKKNCIPRLACSLVRLMGSVGLLAVLPTAVEVKVPVA